MTRPNWQEARRYVLPALTAGYALLLARRRAAWLAFAAAASVAWFFRDPDRPLSAEPDVVYAAADGVVANVDHAADDPWVPGERGLRVSTFLALYNVHVNRSPVAGQIVAVQPVTGSFAPALLSRSRTNHKYRLILETNAGRVVVEQIAGMIARKISCWVQPLEQVTAGQRIGLIHFGSRTDVILPAGSAEVFVRPGDHVRAGVTPLARYRAEQGDSCGSS